MANAQAETALSIEPTEVAKLDESSKLPRRGHLARPRRRFRTKVEDIRKLGDEDIRTSASVSNTLLDKPMAPIQTAGSQASTVSRSLLELRRTVENLDPAHQGDMFSPKKLLGVLPFGAGGKLRDYFGRYQWSQHTSTGSSSPCTPGRTSSAATTPRSSASSSGCGRPTRGSASTCTWPSSSTRSSRSGSPRSRRPTPPVPRAAPGPPVLRPPEGPGPRHPARRRRPGLPRVELIRKNNLELIKGVDRATTTTISALRTAVIVPQALADPKLVLDQITALSSTTENLIVSTSRCCATSPGRSTSRPPRRPSASKSSSRRSRTSTRPWTRSTPSSSRRSTTWGRR